MCTLLTYLHICPSLFQNALLYFTTVFCSVSVCFLCLVCDCVQTLSEGPENTPVCQHGDLSLVSERLHMAYSPLFVTSLYRWEGKLNLTCTSMSTTPVPTDQSEARTEIHHRHMSHTHTGFNETQTMWTCYTEMQRVTSCVLMYICALC